MKRRQRIQRCGIACLLLLACILSGSGSGAAAKSGNLIYNSDYPSGAAVRALTEPFYMILSITDDVEDEGVTYRAEMKVEIASNGSAVYTRSVSSVLGMSIEELPLTDGNGVTWVVDPAAKTYKEADKATLPMNLSDLRFQKQGRAKVNGIEMIYDRYQSGKELVTFYMKDAKLHVLSFTSEGNTLNCSVIHLGSDIPTEAFFEVPGDYKKSSSAGSVPGIGGMNLPGMGDVEIPDIEGMIPPDTSELMPEIDEETRKMLEDLGIDVDDVLGGIDLEGLVGGN